MNNYREIYAAIAKTSGINGVLARVKAHARGEQDGIGAEYGVAEPDYGLARRHCAPDLVKAVTAFDPARDAL